MASSKKRSAAEAELADGTGGAAVGFDATKQKHQLEFADGTGAYTLERKPWESATAFCARCDWVEKMRHEGLGADTQEEAEEVDRLSSMWYNMVYLGCRYDEELEERLGNPTSLVKMPEKEGTISQLDAARMQQGQPRVGVGGGGGRGRWVPLMTVSPVRQGTGYG